MRCSSFASEVACIASEFLTTIDPMWWSIMTVVVVVMPVAVVLLAVVVVSSVAGCRMMR